MMLEPSMNVLLGKIPSRYMLVNVVAQRARQISSEAADAGPRLEDKPVSIAIREVAARRVTPGESETAATAEATPDARLLPFAGDGRYGSMATSMTARVAGQYATQS